MTKQRIPPTALELFKRWHRNYERKAIVLHRIGFTDEESDHFSLRPWREGKRLDYMHGCANFPYIEMLKSDPKRPIDIRPSTGVHLHRQLGDECWRLIEEQYLKDRHYFVRVKPGFLDRYYVEIRQRPYFPAQFYTRPAIKRGVVLNPRDQEPWPYLHWSAFVPKGTPEHAAIEAADQLARRVAEAKLKPPQEEINRLHEDLFEKVKLVPV